MATDINALNQEIANLRKQLGDKPLTPFDSKDLDKALLTVRALRQEFRESSEDLDYISKSFKDTVNEMSKQNIYFNSAKKSINSISDIARQLNDYRRGENSLSEKQLKNLQNQSRIKFEELKLSIRSGQLKDKDLIAAQAALDEKIAFNTALNQTIELQAQVNKEIGLMGSGLEGAGKFLEKMGFAGIAKPISDAIQKTKDARFQILLNKDAIESLNEEYQNTSAADVTRRKELRDQIGSLKSQNKELDTQSNKYKNVAIALKEQITLTNMTDFAIGGIIKSFLEVDTMIGNTAKSLGISYKESLGLNASFTVMAANSNSVFVTTKGINESFNQINAALGTNATLSQEILVFQTKMVKQAGYSVEAATMLSKLSLATGKPAKEITTAFLGQAKALNLANGTAINEKQLLEDISKISKDTLATFAGQPGKLAEAAYEARKLGLDLEKLKGTQSALLDIESSIANEFEAEVLTGKQLNLEKARYFALTNDYAGLARELGRQDITRASFAKMNVIQQEATAKALGMSADTMGGMLMDQEAMTKLSSVDGKTAKEKFDNLVKQVGMEEAKKRLGDETLASQMESASVQDRFTASVEKLKEVFVAISTVLMPIFDGFANLVTWLAQSKIAMVAILGVVSALVGFQAALAIKSIITAIASIFSGSFMAGPFGLPIAIAGVAALTGMVAGAASMAGDINSPADGKTQISTKEGGLFELSKNDDVVAFPGASKALNNPTQIITPSTTQQSSPMIDPETVGKAMGKYVYDALIKAPLHVDFDMNEHARRFQKTPSGQATRKI
jgi:hypothetical protein